MKKNVEPMASIDENNVVMEKLTKNLSLKSNK